MVFSAEKAALSPAAKAIDKENSAVLKNACARSHYKGEVGEILDVFLPDGRRIILAGLGKTKTIDEAAFMKIGAKLVARYAVSGETQLHIDLENIEKITIEKSKAAAALAQGVELRSWRFDKYRTTLPSSKKPSLRSVTILLDDTAKARNHFNRLQAVDQGVFLARSLVTEPGNVINPKNFVAIVKKALTPLGVKVSVLGRTQMQKLGMGAFLGVAQGSDQEPQLLVLDYRNGKAKDSPLALVGKGVTFDTGGISLKPPLGMEAMKWDMGGAGAVAGAMCAIAGRKAKANVIGLCGLAENMPSGKAQRPGDVVKSMSGQTIEVINTDAEGRLILCDVITYVQKKYKPCAIIDLATLTGAIIMALSSEYAGLFSNSDSLSDQLLDAAKKTDEKLWRFPMGPTYNKMIDSSIADMKNVGPRDAGSITAAQFLERFVENGKPWAHLDIAGTVWTTKDGDLWKKGASGYGVRLLDQLVSDHFEGR